MASGAGPLFLFLVIQSALEQLGRTAAQAEFTGVVVVGAMTGPYWVLPPQGIVGSETRGETRGGQLLRARAGSWPWHIWLTGWLAA